MINKIFKFFVKLWRKFFPKKYIAIKPTGCSSLVSPMSSGIEPLPSGFNMKPLRSLSDRYKL